MDDILLALRTILAQAMIDDESWVAQVEIFDPKSAQTKVELTALPAICIVPSSERPQEGPFVSTQTIFYQINLLVVVYSAKLLAYRIVAIEGTPTNENVYAISKQIRKVLYQNKRLFVDGIENAFEMRQKFDGVESQDKLYSQRRISIEYTHLERYEGMVNDQASLALPPPVNF